MRLYLLASSSISGGYAESPSSLRLGIFPRCQVPLVLNAS